MVFSSLVFLCVFLPVTLFLHWLMPGIRAKNAILLIASLVFYAYGEPVYLFLLLASALGNYGCARLIGRFPGQRHLVTVLDVTANLLVLIIFKYAGFLTETVNIVLHSRIPVPEIHMPLGISFFTFQAMSYVLDVSRGKTEVEKSFQKVLLYIVLFPQLIAGPIVKYHDIAQELQKRTLSVEETAKGMRRFIAGLCKKVLIANTMGLTADTLFAVEASKLNAAAAWLGVASYVFQIYFDFSGYSDMAIGLGQMFGFHFHENFLYPYISGSIREFWRRWHISLTDWFREYLYIPLGGNRKGKARTVCNKLIVFLCTGIWHGAAMNFLVWGIYHGFFMMLEEYIPAIGKKGGRIKSVLQHIYTMLVVAVGFMIFRADTMSQAFVWLKEMFTGFRWNTAAMSMVLQQLTPVYILTFLAAVLASMPLNKKIDGKRGAEGFRYFASLAGLLLCVLNLAGGTYNPFIYFRF